MSLSGCVFNRLHLSAGHRGLLRVGDCAPMPPRKVWALNAPVSASSPPRTIESERINHWLFMNAPKCRMRLGSGTAKCFD